MRILITGAFGYLGGRISSFFSSIPEYEIILASTRAVKIPYSSKNIKVVQINWNDEKSISNACTNIDIIVHTAGMNAHDCSTNPVDALNVNGFFTAKLVRNAISKNVETKYLIETGSSLIINGKEIKDKSNKVIEKLYGSEYGKSSK